MQIDIRPLEAREAEAFARVYADAYAQPPWCERMPLPEAKDYLDTYLTREGFMAWRATLDGAPAGVALGVLMPSVGGPFFRLEDLCVAPAHQRRGVGAALLGAIAEETARLGCDMMLLGTQPDVPAHGFYLKQGFRDTPAALMFKKY